MVADATEADLHITLMSFEEFTDAVLSRGGIHWKYLLESDCIAGGLDIGFDFM